MDSDELEFNMTKRAEMNITDTPYPFKPDSDCVKMRGIKDLVLSSKARAALHLQSARPGRGERARAHALPGRVLAKVVSELTQPMRKQPCRRHLATSSQTCLVPPSSHSPLGRSRCI